MKHFNDGLIAFLKNATTKLEELQVQTNLGKAELSDKVEGIKKESRLKLNELKINWENLIEKKDEYSDLVKGKLEYLELQLALGKADTLDEINIQKKKIQTAINEIKEQVEKVL